mgnify:CR=1 FL=1
MARMIQAQAWLPGLEPLRLEVVPMVGWHMGINMNKFGITALSATALLGSLAFMNAAHAQSTWNVYSGSNGGSGCAQNATNSGNYNTGTPGSNTARARNTRSLPATIALPPSLAMRLEVNKK